LKTSKLWSEPLPHRLLENPRIEDEGLRRLNLQLADAWMERIDEDVPLGANGD
jgi:hypothetical protein